MPRWMIAVLIPACLLALAAGLWLGMPQPPPAGTFAADDPELGRRTYVFCQACHGIDGSGTPGISPAFRNAPLASAPDPSAAIRTVLAGTAPGRFNSQMPAFAGRLTDHEIAAVLTHIRSRWATAPAVTAEQVARLRQP